jgi:hypothetical protein
MVPFLAFLVFMTFLLPMVPLSELWRLALAVIFALTLIMGALATVRHRVLIGLISALSVASFAEDMTAEFAPQRLTPVPDTTLKLVCLSILIVMTIKQTFRPGPMTIYRVMGGIAGYLLIGFTWTYAYQLVIQFVPDAIHFVSGVTNIPTRQPTHLMYFSFVTLTTVGYGDAYPVYPAARSLAMSEALVGQLYVATLIGALVGMALQTRSTTGEKDDSRHSHTQDRHWRIPDQAVREIAHAPQRAISLWSSHDERIGS